MKTKALEESTSRNRELKVHERLDLLARAEVLKNVRQACDEFGVSRTVFYKYRKQFLAGVLKPDVASPKSLRQHPGATPVAVIEQVVNLAREHPQLNGRELSAALQKSAGIYRSATTICKILKSRGLTRRERLHLKKSLEGHSPSDTAPSDTVLSVTVPSETVAPGNASRKTLAGIFPERTTFRSSNAANDDPKLRIPTWKEKEWQPEGPGQKLCQYVLLVRDCGVLGSIYAHCIVDSYTMKAWARCSSIRSSIDAAYLLRDEVLPFFAQLDLPVQIVATPRNRIFCAPVLRPSLRIMEERLREEPAFYQARIATREKHNWLEVSVAQRSYRPPTRTQRRDWRARKEFSFADPANKSPEAIKWRTQMDARRHRIQELNKDKGWRPFTKLLQEAGLKQVAVESRGANFNSLALRFHKIIRQEFFSAVVREHPWRSIEDLQIYLMQWLQFYNRSRANIGFPNQGKTPDDALASFLRGNQAGNNRSL